MVETNPCTSTDLPVNIITLSWNKCHDTADYQFTQTCLYTHPKTYSTADSQRSSSLFSPVTHASCVQNIWNIIRHETGSKPHITVHWGPWREKRHLDCSAFKHQTSCFPVLQLPDIFIILNASFNCMYLKCIFVKTSWGHYRLRLSAAQDMTQLN